MRKHDIKKIDDYLNISFHLTLTQSSLIKSLKNGIVT